MFSEATYEPATGGDPGNEFVDLSREECLKLLACGSLGRVAVNIGETAPVIRPVNYMFDGPSQSVVFRTAHGSKLHALLRSVDASFEIDGVDESTGMAWSVILQGRTGTVTNPIDLRRLETLGVDTWAPGHKPYWVQIRAWTVSGRRIRRA